MAATEAYPVAAGEYDKVADKQGFWKVFQEFDKDGSGAVDNDEMKAMVESLGMIVSDKELAAMVKDADEDSSGEIEFPEFVAVIQKAAAAGVAGHTEGVHRPVDGRRRLFLRVGGRARLY